MIWDPDFKDFAEWESVPQPYQEDFKSWVKNHETLSMPSFLPGWIDPKMPWSMYRHEYIAYLLDREIQNEFEEEETTPARVANESGSQQSTQTNDRV